MLYDKLKNYSKSGIYPFHMPGHKRMDITEEGIIPYNIDITEIHDLTISIHQMELLMKFRKRLQNFTMQKMLSF